MTFRLLHRMLAAVVAVSALVLGTTFWLAGRAQGEALRAQVESHALVLSDTIKNSTRQAMLLDEREMVHGIVESIGRRDELATIRVFNKDGEVLYSPDPTLVGTTVNKRNEACFACHADGEPAGDLPPDRRTRLFTGADGERRLGIINPIRNEPACSSAACHAHGAGQAVLGVLDVSLSLADVDREVARGRRFGLLLSGIAIAAVSLLLWAFFRRLVGRPVERLLTATRAVADGDLGHRIPVSGGDELGQLARSFNEMTTRVQEARNQVYQASKLASLGRMAAGIAHEINNPLTGVLTYSSFLLKRADEGSEVRQDLETIVHETKRCRTIVRGLLDFSRQVPPTKRRVVVEEIATRALDIVDNQMRVQNIRVTTSFGPDLPQIEADPNQLQQVLINLLVNAADALEEPPKEISLAVSCARRSGREVIRIEVTDNGVGIPEANLPKLFEPFFTTKEQRGTGLGLSVVWGIVAEHGGLVGVVSEVGRGTTFTIDLPLPDGPPLTDERPP